jgi:CheY-like chemotaxis protein
MAEDRNRCLREGMNDYLAKPVDMNSLDGVLARWLFAASEDAPVRDLDLHLVG